MGRHLARRLGGFLVTLLVVATVSFFLLRLAPGGPFDEERAVDVKIREAQERKYGLDRPLVAQYALYMRDLCLRGDLGPSSQYPGMTVNEVVAESFPFSLALGGLALAVALALGLAGGVAAGARPGGVADRVVGALSTLGISVPNFVLGTALLAVFALWLRVLPVAGLTGIESLVLPSLTLGLPFAAVIARLTRAGLLDSMEEDWIRTARAKGLKERRVVWLHALRPALLPVVSFLGPTAAGVLTGSVVVERIFALPGLGTHFVNSALNRDYSLVMGTVLLYSALLIAMNLLSDLLLGVLDPRIREGR
ncbi:MAG: ABC transporter permease [Planctomycetota bacterium]|jgi:oligopeptide transport system permease protein